jgi:hypothetical protein
MKIKCPNCEAMQVQSERDCFKCGSKLGGFANEKFILISLGVMALVPIFLFSTSVANDFSEIMDARIFFWYYLPIISVSLIFYDYHPTRRGIYFYGTALVSAASFYFFK